MDRDRFVEGHRPIVEAARSHPGCLDLSISPDPIESGRVNNFECWESQEALDAFRAVAPRPSASVEIRDAQVLKHDVSHTGPPFDWRHRPEEAALAGRVTARRGRFGEPAPATTWPNETGTKVPGRPVRRQVRRTAGTTPHRAHS
ncbi:antibiotic biosynthesis monooxygenase [Streptomyces pristinaespiralis ATCC 25486]|uniref:Antibiotic biosynthesis monooxygenase n=2 Tax=Streptomyces pristinaespiralis TaxID=38300 RepID=B5H7G8_STRE2|nr:antibiotic biosynthesis monooxygenase [Streptomyces pristinaespiralis ATCC 25486]